MKTMLKIVMMLVGVALIQGCLGRIVGSGDQIPVTKGLEDFDRISISHGCEATITRSDEFLVEVWVDDNVSNHLNIVKENRTLKIYLDPAYTYTRYTLEAEIALPVLESVALSGASVADIAGFDSEYNFDASLSGASVLYGDLTANDFDLRLSGASQAEISGTGDDLDIAASGASILELGDLPVDDAEVVLSGGSEATIRLDGTLNAEASGGSELYYYGNPTLGNIRRSGGSRIERKEE